MRRLWHGRLVGSAGRHQLPEQFVEPADELARVGYRTRLGQFGLIEHQQRQLAELILGMCRIQTLDQRVMDVDLEFRLRLGHCLPGRGHDAPHLRAHVALVEHQTGRGIGEAGTNLDLGHALIERILDALQQFLVFLDGLFGCCLYNLGINDGERTVNAGTGSMLISCIPILVILLGVFTGREKVGLLAWLGIGLSMTGVVLTAAGSETGFTFNLGSLLILGAALCAAIQTLISKALTQRYAAVDVTTWAIWFGTLGLLPFSEDLPGAAGRLSGLGWLHLVFLGTVPAALCYTIWSWVLVTLPITTVMSAVYAIPVFSVLFGWLILGEQPSALTLVGGAVTLAGVAWVQSLTRKQR